MNPEEFPKNLYKELALGFKKDYDDVKKEIETFESIFRDKRFGQKTKQKAVEVLKILYQDRDDYEKTAKHYRKSYQGTAGCKRVLGWCKDRT